MPGAGEAIAFIGKAFRRPDGERVARLAVEKLALLAAAAALNAVSPRHAAVVRRHAPCRESCRHVRRGGSWPVTISAACWSGHCRDYVSSVKRGALHAGHPRLSFQADKDVDARDKPGMTTPRKPIDGLPHSRKSLSQFRQRSPTSARRAIWKFWGTTLWGLFIFAAMFLGQVAVIVYFVLRQVRLVRRRPGDPRRQRGLDHIALGDPGTARRSAGDMGRDPSTRIPFADYLALRWTSWRDFLVGVAALAILVGSWDLLSRALGREVDAGLHGRRAEIRTG